MKNLALLGAFDRYNYGDLLFPIVVEHYFKTIHPDLSKDFNIEYYGLIESDLSKYGGKKTKRLSDLKSNISKSKEEYIIIVSGGEVLPARWHQMHEHISKNRMEHLTKKVLRKLLGKHNYEKIIRKEYGLTSLFPWVISKKDFGNSTILYNSVGGSNIDNFSENELEYVQNCLEDVEYFSVRDKLSYENFNVLNPVLSPDSAITISEIYPMDKLEKLVDTSIKNTVKNLNNGYFCFQTNLVTSSGKEKQIAQELEKIYYECEQEIFFLPIGFAAGHDNHIALEKIQKEMNVPFTYNDSLTIFDIMYIIANASFFAGTSLHGCVTASSYAIPHMGIGEKIVKLESFLETWDLKVYERNIDINNLYNSYNKFKNIDRKELDLNRKHLTELAIQNFEKMFNFID